MTDSGSNMNIVLIMQLHSSISVNCPVMFLLLPLFQFKATSCIIQVTARHDGVSKLNGSQPTFLGTFPSISGGLMHLHIL